MLFDLILKFLPSYIELEIGIRMSVSWDKIFTKPFLNLMNPLVGKEKVGTYVYRGNDNLIDQIIISSGLANKGPLKVMPGSLKILDLPKYRQQEGKYAHYPFRFWAGNRLLGGYSDHLAISCVILIDN